MLQISNILKFFPSLQAELFLSNETKQREPPCSLPKSPDLWHSHDEGQICVVWSWYSLRVFWLSEDIMSPQSLSFILPTFVLLFTFCSSFWPVSSRSLLLLLQFSSPNHCWVLGTWRFRHVGSFRSLWDNPDRGVSVLTWCQEKERCRSRAAFISVRLPLGSVNLRFSRKSAEICMQAGSGPPPWLPQGLVASYLPLGRRGQELLLCRRVRKVFPSVLRIQRRKGTRANSDSFNP